MIVLHEMLLFWYLTEAADGSPSDVTNEGNILYHHNSACRVANEGHHYTGIHVRWQEWNGGEYVVGAGGGCVNWRKMGLIFLTA
jgi:hypothetical protein